MWQRIQTVWLLLVVLSMILFTTQSIVAFVDPANGVVAQQMFAWNIKEVTGLSVAPSWPVGVLSTLSAFLAFVSVFLFKNSVGRTFQIRLGVLNIFILFGLLGYIGVATYLHIQSTGLDFGLQFALGLPLMAMVLQYLAVRSILRDETLIRMSNRLR